MKSNLLILSILFLVTISINCRDKKAGDLSSTPANSNSSIAGSQETLPFLSSQEVNTLYSQAEKVDIIFYKLPMSVNQEEPASAKNTVLYVSPAAPIITKHCEPAGRLSWISDGKIIREADFFVGEGCNYFVFMENEKPAYENAMALEGVQFFQTVMSQVRPPDQR